MSTVTPRAPLSVCVIAQNRLAAAYLKQLLQVDSRIRLLSHEQYTRLSPTCRRKFIFVIDQCGFDVPLCECLRQLRDHCSDPRFLVLDQQKSTDEILRLIIMGVHGFVTHADAPRAIIPALLCIATDQFWVPQEVFKEFLHEVGSALRREARARPTMTHREHEILELVRRRLSNREIGDILRIRVSTVKFHISNILLKMQARNRHALWGVPSGNAGRTLLP